MTSDLDLRNGITLQQFPRSMNRPRHIEPNLPECEVIDFDEVLLNACAPEERADLLTEARILSSAFSESGSPDDLQVMARTLTAGRRDSEMGQAHARKVAAALRRLAKEPWG